MVELLRDPHSQVKSLAAGLSTARRTAMAVISEIDAYAVTAGVSLKWTENAGQGCLTTTIVVVTDSEGTTGVGAYDGFTPGPGDLSVLESVRSLAGAVLGRDTDCQETLLQDLRVGVVFPFPIAALSLIDMALWDLAAKRRGLPLCDLLGRARDQIAAYASLPTMGAEEDYVEVVGRAQADGLQAVKVHAWGDPAKDIKLLTRLRTEYPALTLMHDAEGVYDHRAAQKVAEALEALNYRWFEAPLPDFDLCGYRELRRRVSIPVLPAGYAMWDLRQFAEALRDSPWSAVRSSVGSLGVGGLHKLMLLAAAFGLDLEPVSYGGSLVQAAGLHVMLSATNCGYFELPYPVGPWELGARNPIRPDVHGLVTAPDGPGLGVEVDWEHVEKGCCGKVSLSG
jgi:L-alanine-DL-glutamate epimerase-like enolase superfamily enzyme